VREPAPATIAALERNFNTVNPHSLYGDHSVSSLFNQVMNEINKTATISAAPTTKYVSSKIFHL
jgi:hypothetical protein